MTFCCDRDSSTQLENKQADKQRQVREVVSYVLLWYRYGIYVFLIYYYILYFALLVLWAGFF